MEQVRGVLLIFSAIVLAALIPGDAGGGAGPPAYNRIVAVNVISTLVIAELVLLSVWLREDLLVMWRCCTRCWAF